MNELFLTSFIKSHEDWEKLLSEKPYCIKIKRDGGLIMFSYNQIESDFQIELVRECRGIILEDGSWRVVCFPFMKFGNYAESYAPEIDWASARTEQKVDGSLIKLFFYGGVWRVATNGNIDAYKSPLPTQTTEQSHTYENFGQLLELAATNAGLDVARLDKGKTYMFEMVSPYTKVIIPYGETTLYHIGTRDNVSFCELSEDVGVQKVKSYPLHTLEACIESAKLLPFSEEGYVVVDKYWQRVKIKSPEYVAAHHIKGNDGITTEKLLKLVLTNETPEFLTYFPEFTADVRLINEKIDAFAAELQRQTDELSEKNFESKKDFALYVKDEPYSGFFFGWYKDNALLPRDWIFDQPTDRVFKMLKL